jgi:hypothetical protein
LRWRPAGTNDDSISDTLRAAQPLCAAMSTDAPFTAIRNYLTTHWTTTDIAWPNEPFTRPSGDLFVAVDVDGRKLEQIEIGNPSGNAWRERGRLWLHVYAPAGSGSLTARQYLKTLANLFRDQVVDFVVFRNASFGWWPWLHRYDIDGWWRVSIAIDWSYEDH